VDILQRQPAGFPADSELFSRVREIGRRVRPRQSGTMVLRWTAARAFEAERDFRKLVGYRAMLIFLATLRAYNMRFKRTERRIDG
jgi:hypothetical protein